MVLTVTIIGIDRVTITGQALSLAYQRRTNLPMSLSSYYALEAWLPPFTDVGRGEKTPLPALVRPPDTQ